MAAAILAGNKLFDPRELVQHLETTTIFNLLHHCVKHHHLRVPPWQPLRTCPHNNCRFQPPRQWKHLYQREHHRTTMEPAPVRTHQHRIVFNHENATEPRTSNQEAMAVPLSPHRSYTKLVNLQRIQAWNLHQPPSPPRLSKSG